MFNVSIHPCPYVSSSNFSPSFAHSAIIAASSISGRTLVALVATTSGRIETPLKAYTILRSVESRYEGEVSMAGWFFARELCTAWNNADPRGFRNRWSLSLFLSLSATRGLRVDRGYNEIASLSLEILIQNSWKLIFRWNFPSILFLVNRNGVASTLAVCTQWFSATPSISRCRFSTDKPFQPREANFAGRCSRAISFFLLPFHHRC